MTEHQKYLTPTEIIDSNHSDIIRFAQKHSREEAEPVEQAVALYYAVRDGIWYDPYYPFYLPDHYRASNVLRSGRGYCVCKASLLCALGRVREIPTRVGFADVRNHLATKQLIEYMGSDLFVYHGFVEFFLDGKWVKATPAFNKELCERHKVAPLEFNGREDSLFHPYNEEKELFMEYVADHGVFSDIPVAEIVSAWERAYGKDRVKKWIKGIEEGKDQSGQRFQKEDPI